MKSILKAIKGKPSIALQHMIDGLVNQSKRKDFVINMMTYGSGYDKVCFGCAATSTIQNICKVRFTPEVINFRSQRARATNTDHHELAGFEISINDARTGHLMTLFDFCQISHKHDKKYDNRFDLDTDNWEGQLPKVRTLIKELKQDGY